MAVLLLAVQKRDGTFDPKKRILVLPNDDGTFRFSLDIPDDTEAPVVRINEKEFRSKVKEYALRRAPKPRQTDEERRKARSAQNQRYRQKIRAKRKERTSRWLDGQTKSSIQRMLRTGKSGAEISIETGVSTSTVSRIRIMMQKEGSTREEKTPTTD